MTGTQDKCTYKILRANHDPYIFKILRKAIMRRSSSETKYFKRRNNDSFRHMKNKIYCNRFYQKEKKEPFRNLNLSVATDNKNFWKVVKP